VLLVSLSYREALNYLYNLTNYEIKVASAYAPQFFDLRRVQRLLDALGNPELEFKSLHIAGTKGKGSTSAMLASVLNAAGYRTGLYTSPHVHSFRERIQVNEAMIPEADFSRLAAQLRVIAEADKELTTFEVATALAFAYFAEAGVEIAVVEVGLGGRLDATNVILPIVAVITTIGHDHMHILGHTLEQIAGEKAGIIKQGVPVVSAPQARSARAVIEQVSAQKRAPLHLVGQEWHWQGAHRALECQQFSASRRAGNPSPYQSLSYQNLCLPLLGKHQLRNAAVVLETIEVLRELGIAVHEQAVRQGLRRVTWPARFEIMGRHPYFVVDGAHNVDSARVLARTLHEHFPGIRPWFVLGILSDKDIPAILQQLLPQGQGATLVQPRHPRATDPHQLQEQAARYGIATEVVEDVGDATRLALQKVGPDGLVLATGSFTTAGAAREAWLRLHNLPLPPLDPL
jgi:dihydrofolate synthase/folylpolyglutamate synthase